MWEKNLPQRLLLIGLVLAAALWVLVRYDSERGFYLNLRPGLDIAGGVSMIFEIQDEPGADDFNVAENMVELLKKRVDPQGVYDLDWRVIGANRIEVQMPLPPPGNAQLRDSFLQAQQALFEANITSGELETMFRLPPEQRAERIAEMAGADQELAGLLTTAAEKFDAYQQVAEQAPAEGDDERARAIALRAAREELEDAKDLVLARNMPAAAFQSVRDMEPGQTRRASIDALKERYPEYAQRIDAAIAAWDEWREKGSFLEGPADLRRLLRGSGVLEFRILTDPSPDNITKYDRLRKQLEERGPLPVAGDTDHWFRIDNPVSFFQLRSPQELAAMTPQQLERTGVVAGQRGDDWYVMASDRPEDVMLHEPGSGAWKLKSAYPSRDEHGRQSVAFQLDAVGGSRFSELTSTHIGDQLAILIDDVAYSHATIQSRIGTSGQITGDFSREKVMYLVQTMQAGALPARLKDTPLSEVTIGSSLGDQNLRSALRAGVIGAAAVLIVMIAYYTIGGAIANAAVLFNVLLVLAAMAMLGARFTLAGIAGIILTIGMAVDANVLIFERMREEKERGSSLRMIIKNGYDKALSTIIDSNITTLLTAIIIYRVGSEDIKGFGLTLGWGIVISLFTSLFVTRTIFNLLLRYNLIKDIKMLKLIGVPNIDWCRNGRWMSALSIAIMLAGLVALYMRGKDALDVEFLGGSSVEIEISPDAGERYNDVIIADRLQQAGRQIAALGRNLARAEAAPAQTPGLLRISAPDLSATQLEAMISEPLESEELIERGGVRPAADGQAVVVQPAEGTTSEQVLVFVRGLASETDGVPLAGNNIARANIGRVIDTENPEQAGRLWNLTTTTTNTQLVQYALAGAFGDDLERQPRLSYRFVGDRGLPYPIDARRLEAVVPGLPETATADLTEYMGGAALHFADVSPPQRPEELRQRLANMRLQPDYAGLPWRSFEVIGVHEVGEGLHDAFVVVVVDDALRYGDNPEAWAEQLARPELRLAQTTFDTEQSLRKVTQFKPQIASQSQNRAMLALLLSWMMIIAYMWIRFGRPVYGVAGVAALVHDVLFALAFIGFAGWLGGFGYAIMVEPFKIDMTVIAALLTIIGFSINDTIVIFDRVRERRGRLGAVTPEVINRAINETMSRTILTTGTLLLVLFAMYFFGGASIRPFNYTMIVGGIIGVWSTLAIAAPLLLLGAREPSRRRAPTVREPAPVAR